MGKVFLNNRWVTEHELRAWRIENGYNSRINYKELLQKLPQLSAKDLDFCIQELNTIMAHPAYYGEDGDAEEQQRHRTMLDFMHAERGLRFARQAVQEVSREKGK